MKLRKPDGKEIAIMIETFIIFFLVFHFWDEVKAIIAGIFT